MNRDSAGLINAHEAYSKRAVLERLGISQKFWDKLLDEELPYTTVGHTRWVTGKDLIEVCKIRERASMHASHSAQRSVDRLTKEHVSRVIGMIGEKANVIVRPADSKTGHRIKFASAHDLRRSCAQRLINAGVSAETLKVIFRHSSFATTEKYYGATRSAQSAAAEVQEKLAAASPFVGGQQALPQLSESELRKLKALLEAL